MKKYSCYIPAVLILLLFCSLLLFRGSLIRYASRIMTDGMEPEERVLLKISCRNNMITVEIRTDMNIHFLNSVRSAVFLSPNGIRHG